MEKGIVFNIQRYTINDGPGIRTEVFLKGCPLSCKWCSNPESHKLKIEPGVYTKKCISAEKCGLCIKECKLNALLFAEVNSEESTGEKKKNILVGIDRTKCVGCVKCADACPSEAIKSWGKEMTVSEVVSVVERDKTYYEKSGGGVTISGGEPLVQADFTIELLKAFKEKGIHTCLESTLCGPFEKIREAIKYADILICDIKHMDTEIHKKYTGLGNEKTLENLKRVSEAGKEMIIRIPVIPGVNDDQDNIEKTAEFVNKYIGKKLRTLQLLSFMRMGEEKCRSLDIPYLMKDLEFDRDEFQNRVKEIAEYFNSRGIHAIVGTKEKE